MKTFGFVHGAWHGAWCWDKLRGDLALQGHTTFAVDLPVDDPDATFDDHAQIVTDVLSKYDEVILVGHSRGGNIIPRVAQDAVKQLVFLCGTFEASLTESQIKEHSDAPADILPGFTAGIVQEQANLTSFDQKMARDLFYQDCNEIDAQAAIAKLRLQRRAAEIRLKVWPDTPAVSIFCQDDRVVNPEWSRYAAQHWLNTTASEIPGGHSPFLSRPQLLASALIDLSL
jgi:pimeloyl-ACP methyl ester carboxylesterase